jgi:hypothetical protein
MNNYDVTATVRITLNAIDEESAEELVARVLNTHLSEIADSPAILDTDVTNTRARFLGPAFIGNADTSEKRVHPDSETASTTYVENT